jgi:hypothetical protein
MQPTGQAVIIQDKRLIAKMENKLWSWGDISISLDIWQL